MSLDLPGNAVLLTACGAHVLAVMSPGPDFAMVTRQTLAYGRRAGVLTAVGIALGICCHLLWAVFGLAWATARVPLLIEALRYGGALFLIWMGLGALRAQPQGEAATVPAAPASHRSLGIGVVTNLLNPKCMMFVAALYSSLIAAQTSLAQRGLLALWIVATTATWFSLVAWSLGHPGVRAALLRRAHWIDRGMGVLLIALGLASLASGLLRG